jgi:peptidoglycan/xylan/chitin deacetylase (PgdA/CDA1 family)
MSNNLIKNSLSPMARFLPLEKLQLSNGQQFIFPFWHAVTDEPPPHLSQLYSVSTVSEFERDLDFFCSNFKSATVDEVSNFEASKRISGEPFFFPTFDDGLSECYSVIAPILKRKGIPAAFFVNSSFVDNKLLFHRHKASLILNRIAEQPPGPDELKIIRHFLAHQSKITDPVQFLRNSVFTDHALLDQIAAVLGVHFSNYLAQQRPYMTLEQIRELQNDGFLIGAHSADHREFYLSSEAEIMSQISSGMEFIDREIKPPTKWFAFPFTDFKVADSVFEKANQSKLWNLSFGTAGIKDETMPGHLQRIPMESGKSADGKHILRTEIASSFLKTLLGKNKVRRQ